MPRHAPLSDEDARTLIKEVAKRPCLWDTVHENYNDRYQMAKAWMEIADILNVPDASLRVKWKSIRDMYKKEAKKYGQIENYTGKWKYFELVTFLDKVEKDIDLTNDTEDDKEEDKDEDNEESNEVPVVKREFIDLDITEDEPDKNNEVLYYYNENYDDPLPEKRMKTSSDDEYDLMFLKSLAPYLKQLDPIRKLVVRNKMQDMLLNEIAAQESNRQAQLKNNSRF